MAKKPVRKLNTIAEAVVWGVFIIAAGLAALSLLNANAVVLTDSAKAVVGYALATYAAAAFGYLVYKAVDNKA